MLKRVAVKLALLLFALVFVCAALEIVLAFAKINTKSNIVFDAAKGITHVPHAYYRHTKEGYSEGYYNAAGLRDAERSETKPPGTYRIEVLGDSYIEALEVDLAKTFPALLEKTLGAACAPEKVEVMNFGQSGFGTAEEQQRYVNFGARYQPDMVLLAFYVGNDFRNNSRLLNGAATGFYYTPDGSGGLRLDRSLVDQYLAEQTLPKRAFTWVKERSYLASLISERVFLLKRAVEERRRKAEAGAGAAARDGGALARAAEPGASGARTGAPNGDEGRHEPAAGSAASDALDDFSDENIYRTAPPPEWERAFTITRGVLGKLAQDVRERGATLVIVVIAAPEQVVPAKQVPMKRAYGEGVDVERPTRLVQAWAAELGVPCLALGPAFITQRAKTGRYLYFGPTGGGHWNEQGHALAAETVAHFLHENHLLGGACP